jgi:zinc transport system ATP-binding protein
MSSADAAEPVPALATHQLTAGYGDVPVVREVDLTVGEGQLVAVVGPNGAGKSTLLSAVLGQTAFAGDIRLHFRGNGRIAYVPQSFVADKTLPITIGEFLALARQSWPVCFGIRAAARARIAAILERVGLPGMERRRIAELSGGELRRVLIGNALDPAPEILLCDEPSTGLDPDAVLQLDKLLAGMRDEHGTTVLMVSHDREQVRRIADQVSVLDGGVKRTGTADEVFAAREPALREIA